MTKRFDHILKLIDNDYASVVSEGTSADISGFIDTGSYALNAALSGSIYGGLPDNKVTALAGEEATGKSFLILGMVKHFLDKDPNSVCFFFETEGSVSKDIMEKRGIDTSRVLNIPIETIQQFRTQALRIVVDYLNTPKNDRVPSFIALDSLGMLSTTKEMEDSEAGKETKDMTRTQLIKAAFRTLTLKLSKARIPCVITNHTYQGMGLFSTKNMSGGQGLKYAASSILFLSKSKLKDSSKQMIGSIITCTNKKSRLVREGSSVKIRLTHDYGLDRYYGLIDFALQGGIWKKLAQKIELQDGTFVREKEIYSNPEKYFTKDVLNSIEKIVKANFEYGIHEPDDVVEEILNSEQKDL